MSFVDAWQNIENHLKADAESVAARVEQDLPVIGQFLQDAAASPVTAALAQAAHLTAVPEGLQMVASFIQQADAAIAAAKAQAAAEAQAAAAAAASVAEPPAV
jgi:hypothetical protein